MSRRVLRWGIGALSVVALACIGLRLWQTQAFKLPYADSFAERRVAEWTPFGGSWRLDGDAISVHATESGAKLSVGSHNWTDYQVLADVELLGHTGNAGIAVRTSDEALGMEALHGYLVTLRSSDAGLEVTRAGQSFLSLAPVRLAGGIRGNNWYRLHVVAVGCRIAAEAVNLETGATAYSGFEDSPSLCLRSGGVALRTTSTAAAWRRIRVTAATGADLDTIAQHIAGRSMPEYPIRERAYSAMREAYLAQVPPEEINRFTSLATFGPLDQLEAAELVRIDDLRSRLWNTEPVRIVGVVTDRSPLYLQDPTAGIRLAEVQGVSFHPGDEVEVLGRPVLDGSVLQFEARAGRFTSDRVSVVPLSVTATQAASGRYEGLLVEVDGVLRSSSTLLNGTLELLLEDDAQRFTVRMPYDLFHGASPKLERNSRVRVRGVCSMERSNESHRGAFVLYANSSSTVMLLEGPPWWTGQKLLWLIVACFVLIGGGIALYGVMERSKLRMVQEERERLSHDMHDTLAQSLAGVGFRLQGIHRTLQSSGAVPQTYVDDLKTTCDLVASAHREASSSIAALHPASEDEGDVLRMLEKSVYSMLEDKDFPVVLSSHGTPWTLSPVVRDTLYRVGREAIANALRHAQAQSIKVHIVYRTRDVVLTVADDGVGFEFNAASPGFGTRSMMRRCEAIKAQLSIISSPGGGCRVQVLSPYRVHRGLIRWVG